jgi:hypothetical protein
MAQATVEPTRTFGHLSANKLLSTKQVSEALQDGRKIWDIAIVLEKKKNEYKKHIGNDTATIPLLKQIRELELEFTTFFTPRHSDSPFVLELIDKRDVLLESVDSHVCNVAFDMNVPFRCEDYHERKARLEARIAEMRIEEFWKDHNLKNFVSTPAVPFPGFHLPGGAFVDIKSLLDGCCTLTKTSGAISEAAQNLLARTDIGMMKLKNGERLYYKPASYEDALHVAELVSLLASELDPDTIYETEIKIGNLMKYHPTAVESYATKQKERAERRRG